MRRSEVLVAVMSSLSIACSGSTIGRIQKSDPGGGHREAGSTGGLAGAIIDASVNPVQDANGTGGGFVVIPRETGPGAGGCSTITFAGENIPVDVLLLVERSNATEDEIPGTTTSWWTATTAGIRSFFDFMSASGNQVGLKIFPVAGTDGATACQADYTTPDVGLSALSGPVAQVIESQLSTRAPGQGRPTGPALEGAFAHLADRAAQLPGHMETVALITRGEPDMCGPSTVDDLKRYVGTIDGGFLPGTVYTIALGASAQNMVTLGYGDPEFFYIPGGDVERAVRDALIRIMHPGSPTCSLRMPQTSSGQEPDFDKIIITIDSILGGQLEVQRVPSAADCDRNGGIGWYAGTLDAAPSIVFCHTTCSDALQIHLLIGCSPLPKP